MADTEPQPQQQPKPARPIGGWLVGFYPPFEKVPLGCATSVRDELIASIKLYSEVEPFGTDLLQARGHQNAAQAFRQFQAYIRQALTFFEAAEVLHHRASPLNYYYACMNFAKAYILLQTPGFIDKGLKHGLGHSPQAPSLQSQQLQISKNGVFPLFYESVTGISLSKGATFKIVDLLGYVSDVQYEYSKLEYGVARWVRCRFGIGHNSEAKTACPIVAVYSIPSFDLSEFELEKCFDLVTVDYHLAAYGLGIQHDWSLYRFYQGKEYPDGDTERISSEVATELAGIISYNPINEPYLFFLNKRIESPELVPMQEFLAIYCLMFHLGSMVRYRPDLLEAMLYTKDAWLIERFTKSAPLAFLRHIRNLIDGKYLAFYPR
jgi:YaaC-like Protein